MAKIYTIHEVRYFYIGLAALGQNQGVVADERVDEVIREALNRFNATRNRKYNLREREFSFHQTPRWILYELRDYGLVEVRGRGPEKRWALTELGRELFQLLRDPANRGRLRERFATLTLDTFGVFQDFLRALRQSRHNGLAGIPLLSSYELDRHSSGHPGAAVERATTLAFQLLGDRFEFEESLRADLHFKLEASVAAGTKQGKTVGAILANAVHLYFLQHFFPHILTSKTGYDLVRNRSSFLGLVNYFREGRPGEAVEIVYPVAQVLPSPVENSEWHCLALSSRAPFARGYLLLQAPEWRDFSDTFLAALQRAYNILPRRIGYAEVADLRDRVCFELRLPDHVFDELLQRAVNVTQSGDLPVRVYVDSSLGDAMPLPKRAPLEVADRAFNLVRVQTLAAPSSIERVKGD